MRVSSTAQISTLVDALAETGWRLWTTAHNNTPAAQRVYRWMKTIAPGHFVLEVTSRREGAQALNCVGELLAITSSHEYTIRTVDGRELRWNNASFVRIPRNTADNHEIFLLEDQSISDMGLDPYYVEIGASK